MRYLFVILFVLLGTSSKLFSQELGKKIKDGKSYLTYAIMQGNTLYSLSKKYQVSEEAIKSANPNINEGLKIGQIIYIPIIKQENSISNKTSKKYLIHVVKKEETLYGISKEYNCSIEAIIALNPGSENGIKVGQDLKIPQIGEATNHNTQENRTPNTANNTNNQALADVAVPNPNDSIIHYTVQKGETLYSISKRFMVPLNKLMEVNHLNSPSIRKGEILIIPLKKEETANIRVRKVPNLDTNKQAKQLTFVNKKASYKILILLPMNLKENAKIISGLYDENTKLNKLTDASIQFLMGAQMAVDSLEKLGLSGEVKFFDTERNIELVKKELTDSNTANWDVVIGPFFPKALEYAAAWGKRNQVPIIAVTKTPNKLLKGNPYLFSLIPSQMTLIGGMAEYLAKNFSDANFVIINGENEATKKRITYFKSVFEKNLPEGTSNHLTMSNIGSSYGGDLAHRLNLAKKNFIICLSDEVQQVMRFVNALNAAKNLSPTYHKADMVIVGLKNWNNFSPLNDYYKNKFDFHYASSNFANYDTTALANFNIKYRAKYQSDPSMFALHGFDATLSQLSTLLLGITRNDGLVDQFEIHPLSPNDGQVNASVFIVEQKDFTLKLLKIVSSKVYFDVE